MLLGMVHELSWLLFVVIDAYFQPVCFLSKKWGAKKVSKDTRGGLREAAVGTGSAFQALGLWSALCCVSQHAGTSLLKRFFGKTGLRVDDLVGPKSSRLPRLEELSGLRVAQGDVSPPLSKSSAVF